MYAHPEQRRGQGPLADPAGAQQLRERAAGELGAIDIDIDRER